MILKYKYQEMLKLKNKNALIPIKNSKWYKIKRFFNKNFNRDNNNKENEISISKKKEDTNIENQVISDKKENIENSGIKLAQKLMSGQTDIDNLTNNQVDEMIVYFEEYVKSLEEELEDIVSRIEKIKKERDR